MKLSRELDYRIRYDVEHDLFHAQNIFSDEYITPTFVEYVQKLEKENAELKSDCRTCVYTDSPCVPSDYPSKDGVCSHYKNVFEENAELKEQISIKDILIKELQEQKAYWKESSFDWRHKFFKLDKVKRLIKKDKQLNNAKEIIKELVRVEYADFTNGDYSNELSKVLEQAEQFLKGESTAEQTNKCHDCAKFDEMPKGPRCRTCDNGSRFQKKEEA